MVKQLIYKSQCTGDITPEIIDDILMSAQRFNKRHGITGILLFSENMFMQFIEGVPHDIDRVYQNICDDPRHRSIQLLYIGYSDERAYPEWVMAAYSTEHLLQHGNAQGYALASTLMEADPDQEPPYIGDFMHSLCAEFMPLPKPDRSLYN